VRTFAGPVPYASYMRYRLANVASTVIGKSIVSIFVRVIFASHAASAGPQSSTSR
ncbi:MAG: hypothetical protein ACI8PT_002551, partial [Gammaproteobacteria bacterium]